MKKAENKINAKATSLLYTTIHTLKSKIFTKNLVNVNNTRERTIIIMQWLFQ